MKLKLRLKDLITKSLNMVYKIREKRKDVMEFKKTIRYGGFLVILDMEKYRNRLELLISIKIELNELI